MPSQIPTNAGASMDASGITAAEIKGLAMSGQENFVPAAEEASQATSHSFLSLAPTTSTGYPVAQSKLPNTLTPRQPAVAVGDEELGEKGVGDENVHAKSLGDVHVGQESVKISRSESMSSEASNSSTSSVGAYKGMSSKRFLKLAPVHFGEAGSGDWSEEVVE